jgi:hypothetical protein
MFLPGDKVKYVGSTSLRDNKANILSVSGKIGEVVAKVTGEPNGFVVEFGDDAFILNGDNLARCYVASETDNSYKPRRRRDPDLEED